MNELYLFLSAWALTNSFPEQEQAAYEEMQRKKRESLTPKPKKIEVVPSPEPVIEVKPTPTFTQEPEEPDDLLTVPQNLSTLSAASNNSSSQASFELKPANSIKNI